MGQACIRCGNIFRSHRFIGYCLKCQSAFGHTVYDKSQNKNVCGLCGSSEIESGYGIGSGYGMGSYNFCNECDTFLDFSEDQG